MTKMIKLSLVAAVAVAGLSTTASAGSLEEAIKGVNINGKVEVGYNYNDNKMLTTNESTNEIEYDLDIQAVVPVNDKITATVAIQADHSTNVDAPVASVTTVLTGTETAGAVAAMGGLYQDVDGSGTITVGDTVTTATGTADTTDTNGAQSITLTKAFFTYANGGTTAMIGKQALNTPFEDDRRGDGIVVLQNFGALTGAVAHFEGVNSPLTIGESVSAAALIGSVSGINASAWYLSSTIADGYSLNVNGNLEGITFDARHTAVEIDDATIVPTPNNETLTKFTASMAIEDITLIAGIAKTNKDSVLGNSLGDGIQNESDADFFLNQLHLGDLPDAKGVLVGASMPVGAATVTAAYLTGSMGDNGLVPNGEFHEINVDASYAMSANFTMSGTFSTAEIETNAGVPVLVDNDLLELSLLYTF